MAESFFGVLKNELVSRVAYPTRDAAQKNITRYIELWHNHKCLHSAPGYRTPREAHTEYEKQRSSA